MILYTGAYEWDGNRGFMTNMKKLKIALSVILSALFVALAVLHVVFPKASIDSTFIVLIIIAFIPWLIPYIKALEISGIGKVELIDRETHEIMQEKIQNLNLETAEADNLTAQRTDGSLDDIVQSDPNLALVTLRIELEKTLRAIAEKNNVQFNRYGLGKLASLLYNTKLINTDEYSLLRDLIPPLNGAAHGDIDKYSFDSIIWTLELGAKLLNSMKTRHEV